MQTQQLYVVSLYQAANTASTEARDLERSAGRSRLAAIRRQDARTLRRLAGELVRAGDPR